MKDLELGNQIIIINNIDYTIIYCDELIKFIKNNWKSYLFLRNK